MKIVLPGGTGQVGGVLRRALTDAGHEVAVLTRRPVRDGEVGWDGRTLDSWAEAVDGSDVVINLAGRSVSCRYTDENLRAMMDAPPPPCRHCRPACGAAAPAAACGAAST